MQIPQIQTQIYITNAYDKNTLQAKTVAAINEYSPFKFENKAKPNPLKEGIGEKIDITV